MPVDTEIEISHATDPIVAAWKGGSLFANSDAYASQVVTREQYREEGHSVCRRRFAAQAC